MIRLLWMIAMVCAAPTLAPRSTAWAETPQVRPATAPTVLILGDSLSAAYGIDLKDGWVWLLQQRLDERGMDDRVVNASVSGETSAGGLSRLPALLAAHRPTLLVVQLGANDGLRGLSLSALQENLTRMVRLGRASGSQALLIGVQLPPNYGAAFNRGFQAVFQAVARSEHIPLVESLLAGVAEDWSLIQPDGLHPTAQAQPRILDNVWPALAPLLAPGTAASPH
jgi:acyl-CoA thioesterase I